MAFVNYKIMNRPEILSFEATAESRILFVKETS